MTAAHGEKLVVFCLEGGVGLREAVLAIRGLAEELLQLGYAVIFAPAVGALRFAILGSTALKEEKERVLVSVPYSRGGR